jgi:predicted Ser/Thr protein kinase
MKTKFSILGIITMLLYSCQDRSSAIENSMDSDSLTVIRNIESKTLKEWFSLNKESDSIIAAAELIIKKHDQTMKLGKQGINHKTIQKLNNLLFHVDEFKKRVNYIKDYEASTETFDQSVVHALDSLKLDYLQEKLKLETAMYGFQ